MLWAKKRELGVSVPDVVRESIALMWKVFNHLLGGLLRCTLCGKSHLGTAATGKLYRYRYYTCSPRPTARGLAGRDR
jgi:hypothetical protein